MKNRKIRFLGLLIIILSTIVLSGCSLFEDFKKQLVSEGILQTEVNKTTKAKAKTTTKPTTTTITTKNVTTIPTTKKVTTNTTIISTTKAPTTKYTESRTVNTTKINTTTEEKTSTETASSTVTIASSTKGTTIVTPTTKESTTKVTTKDESYKEGTKELENATITLCDDGCVEQVIYENFEIHFLELGNEYTGDCTYIKAGDIDILIDAGSRQGSASTIIEYVNEFCTDGVLEYVISTHAHQDHIAGFVGNSSKNFKDFNGNVTGRTGILYYYDIDTLIDFSITDSTTALYNNYLSGVDYAVKKGTKHYTAGDCFLNQNGASSHYVLSESLNISFDVLYNKYYFESAEKTSGEENNYSVCTMFNYGDYHFLLTGDLEIEGEESLAEYYDKSTKEKTLPHVELFKAGHHGSSTSSNDCLLDLITPSICCVCCCAGGNEYTPSLLNMFPTQAFINRIAKHTDRVYVTTKYNEKTGEYESFNGNIIISSNGKYIGIYASNNLIKLKDSDWFNELVYVIDDPTKGYCVCPKLKSSYTTFYNKDTEGAIQVKRRTWPTE